MLTLVPRNPEILPILKILSQRSEEDYQDSEDFRIEVSPWPATGSGWSQTAATN
jgi:hypothetical protein